MLLMHNGGGPHQHAERIALEQQLIVIVVAPVVALAFVTAFRAAPRAALWNRHGMRRRQQQQQQQLKPISKLCCVLVVVVVVVWVGTKKESLCGCVTCDDGCVMIVVLQPRAFAFCADRSLAFLPQDVWTPQSTM